LFDKALRGRRVLSAGTATGTTPHGAILEACVACAREIAGKGPLTEAFAEGMTALEEDPREPVMIDRLRAEAE
jgi:hypothetical protein